jgi:N-acetylglucosamine malate deacetylase 1
MPADTVLVAAPHPDDEILGCGGSIARHLDAGRHVSVLYLTSGEHGSATCPPAGLGPLREQEAAQAMESLGIPAAGLRFVRFPDGGINPAEPGQVAAVIAVLRELRPALLYVPHPGDASYDHRAAYALCWRAAAMAGSSNFPEYGSPHWIPAVLGYEVWSPIPEPSYLEDIGGVLDRKLAALACYQTQSSAAKGTGQASNVGPAAAFLPGFRGATTTGGYREAFAVLRAGRVI